MNEFDISLINHQSIDGQTDTIEENAKGIFNKKDNKIYIIYKTESDSVTIIVSDTLVIVKRKGTAENRMAFERNKKTRAVYHMPYGDMNIEINTEKIVNGLTDRGGKLRLVYLMTMQGQSIHNDMIIQVTQGD